MRVQEQANGIAHTEADTTIVFRTGGTPYLVWRDEVIRIERPERFGRYATPNQRRAFVREFCTAIGKETT